VSLFKNGPFIKGDRVKVDIQRNYSWAEGARKSMHGKVGTVDSVGMLGNLKAVPS